MTIAAVFVLIIYVAMFIYYLSKTIGFITTIKKEEATLLSDKYYISLIALVSIIYVIFVIDGFYFYFLDKLRGSTPSLPIIAKLIFIVYFSFYFLLAQGLIAYSNKNLIIYDKNIPLEKIEIINITNVIFGRTYVTIRVQPENNKKVEKHVLRLSQNNSHTLKTLINDAS